MAKTTKRDAGISPLTNPTGTAIGYASPVDASGPGFYQGMVGRKTGRPAPIPGGHGRTAPRHEQVLAQHGLLESGAADPNQGQLFSPSELGPKKMPKEIASEHDVAPPLRASRPGFMPEMYEKKNAAGVVSERTTPEAHKAMIAGIRRLPAHELEQPGNGPRTSQRLAGAENFKSGPRKGQVKKEAVQGPQLRAPVAEAMHQRQQTYDRQGGDAPWYARRTEKEGGRFDVGTGQAAEMVANAADRHGVSYRQMARTTAIASPRTAWTIGTPGTDDFTAPNLDSAENVVSDIHRAQSTDKPFSAANVGGMAYGKSLGEMKAKAAVDLVRNAPGSAIPISDLASQKVPNFNQSFLLSHPSTAIKAQAAQAYTVDTHDVSSQGHSPDLLKTQGGYAIARMLGRRTALKNNELGPMSQSRVWEGQRTKTPEPLGDASMFETTRGGKVRPRTSALPGEQRPMSQQFDNRSETAKKHGLEF